MGDSLRGQLFKLVLAVALILFLIGAFLRWQYVDVVTVNNDAMAPTFFGGDQILVWRQTEFDHGDIVLCRHPRTPDNWVLGRVIGRPGMSVSMAREQLVINGQRVDRDFQGEFRFEDTQNHNVATFRYGREALGEVHLLFMERNDRNITMRPVTNSPSLVLINDNRTWIGDDSRAFGPVPPEACTGVAFMRWAPGGRAPEVLGQGHLDILD
ncbi:MAG: signal peptidase I [Deltaproteobacteria bacterium]|nr:signal peptidase I [Deltaproteobacteria bacterium]